MNTMALIETTAIAGKVVVENSKMSPIEKELIKMGIDEMKEVLKLIIPHQQPSNIVGLSLQDVQMIKFYAEQCGLDRVVHFPVKFDTGNFTCLMRMYGGDIQQFSVCLGIPLIYPTDGEEDECINFWEKNFGVIIYQREK